MYAVRRTLAYTPIFRRFEHHFTFRNKHKELSALDVKSEA